MIVCLGLLCLELLHFILLCIILLIFGDNMEEFKSLFISIVLIMVLFLGFMGYMYFKTSITLVCSDNQIVFHRINKPDICVDEPIFDGIGDISGA